MSELPGSQYTQHSRIFLNTQRTIFGKNADKNWGVQFIRAQTLLTLLSSAKFFEYVGL
jgi:hypothetical protein